MTSRASGSQNQFVTRVLSIVVALCMSNTAGAQQGDRAGEEQNDLPPELVEFDSPVLSPEAALASIQVKAGFRVELVAAEPLVVDPVAMDFDEDGRLWVVEMRGYMPNVDGVGEHRPVGRVVVLEDTDGDGRMDQSTVFLDHLVQPRAICCAYGGVLVVEPPDLLFFKDTTDDGHADFMRHLYSGFAGLANPEHAGNGLMHTIDNWIHTSQHPDRFLFDGEEVVAQRIPGHGQWGITKDDVGRVFMNTNSDAFRGDLFPSHYSPRNPRAPRLVGVNERFMSDMGVYPSHKTPGVNRGYQKGLLREDGSLSKFTAACGPCIYRGDLFPEEFHGNVFICEPTGNLIKRALVVEEDDGLKAPHAYPDSEFLTSTDERFRPVNLYNGPDGALYLVDMYRGVIQHKTYVTSFLRKQIEGRRLEQPIGLGRIYRIVPEDAHPATPPTLSNADNADLVPMLAHASGWWRDTAQRLLVERKASEQAEAIRSLIQATDDPVARLHGYWTLQATGAATFEDAVMATSDTDPHVRRAGIRLLEEWIDESQTHDVLRALVDDPDQGVRTQVALSLGEGHQFITLTMMREVVTHLARERQVRSAITSGLGGRELDFLRMLLNSDAWAEAKPGFAAYIGELAQVILVAQSPFQSQRLVELAADRGPFRSWQGEAILKKIVKQQRMDSDKPRFLLVEAEPTSWSTVSEQPGAIAGVAATVDAHLYWSGRPGMSGPTGPRALTPTELVRYEEGQRLYNTLCMSCHKESGRGDAGTAPALADNDDVNGRADRLIRILLHGLSGPITVQGESFNGAMPKSPASSDAQLAALLTYVRRSWGNTGDPVTPGMVAEIREQTSDRRQPWTVFELSRIE